MFSNSRFLDCGLSVAHCVFCTCFKFNELDLRGFACFLVNYHVSEFQLSKMPNCLFTRSLHWCNALFVRKMESVDYKLKYENERALRLKLEEELDMLSLENIRLNEELDSLRKQRVSSTAASAGPTAKFITNELLRPGSGRFPHEVVMRIENANSGKNCLVCGLAWRQRDSRNLLLSGGADGNLCVYDSATGSRLLSYLLSSPLLSMAVYNSLVAVGLMDGSVCLIDLENDDLAESVFVLKPHTKYVVSVCWSADGKFLASASHDKTVRLFQRSFPIPQLNSVKIWNFLVTPECCCIVPNTAPREGSPITESNAVTLCQDSQSSEDDPSPWELVVGLRDSCTLLYVQLNQSYSERLVSLNENDWDTHVSFTPLFLSLCPMGKYLLVATDKDYHVVYELGSNRRVRFLGGHCGDEYAKPVVCWDPSRSYVYSNSAQECEVVVYSVAEERVVARLAGHKAAVRYLAVAKRVITGDENEGVRLVSVSHDKSAIVWDI